MKNALIIIILLCLSTVVGATTYYIDPSGNDSNNGTSSSPWKTLAYACSKVTTAGDIIHVNTGTYTETAQSALAVGVSIEGVGVSSVIQSRVGGSSFTISLYSSSQGTNGNQHISNIKMDGSALTAYGAIKVDRRSNVEIFNCTFVDFNYYGVGFDGDGTGNQPTTYPTGNKFHDNTVINCSGYFPAGVDYGDGKYLLGINGQQTMLVYNNILTQTARSAGNNGYCIKGVKGYNKDIKIYNNTITKAPYDNLTWDFAIELWMCRGGIEIYNNIISAGIDLSGDGSNGTGISTIKGSYTYSVWIHDNTIGQSSLSSYQKCYGVLIEQSASDVIIERNIVKNVWNGIYCPLEPKADATGKTFSNITIRYNLFNNIGTSGGIGGTGINCQTTSSDFTGTNIQFYNNTLIGHTGSYYGIQIPAIGTVTNVYVRNNIIRGFDDSGIQVANVGTVNNVWVQNNNLYSCGYSNTPRYNLTIGNLTSENGYAGNVPPFVSSSDFHLTTSKNGIYITTGLTDLDKVSTANPPCIGAYEKNSTITSPIVPVYQSSVVQNTSPSMIEMTYDLSLNNLIVPVASSFSVLVNSLAVTISTVAVSGTKVQLTLNSAIKYGDILTVSYAKPANNPLQTDLGGVAISISSMSIMNNLTSPTKEATPLTITMTISPNRVHRIINVLLAYSSTPTAALSPEILRISDLSGKLFIEKLLITGVTNFKIPLNLRPGIYTILLLTCGLEMVSQKMIVY